MNIGNLLAKLGQSFDKKDENNLDENVASVIGSTLSVSESSNSMIRALTGSIADDFEFYFPEDIIGGTCPCIPGEEEEIVWNAAAEACDTERVHVVWQSFENRIWYLAVRSSDLASHPNTWCPLAALLPTLKDKDRLPLCYTYFDEETAILMVVSADELQIFRGTAAVVRAKAERTSRELGQVTVVNIDPYRIEQMSAVPWYSVSLFEDRARRVLATLSVVAALAITGLSFLVWLSANMSMLSSEHNLADIKERTQTNSMKLLEQAESLRTSPMREQIEKFLIVNDQLLSLNGFLNVYQIKDKAVRWKATVPPSATADRISAMGGKNIESNDRGVIIGNQAEIEHEAAEGKK